jgi:hypothetical protein
MLCRVQNIQRVNDSPQSLSDVIQTSLKTEDLPGCLDVDLKNALVLWSEPGGRQSANPGNRVWEDGLYPGASWEQFGNSIGNVSPMRPQCENTKVATCEPWIRRL